MRLVILCLLASLTFGACQQAANQYAEEGPEIEMAKKAIKAYESQNWASYISVYSDTAKLFHNSLEAMTVEQTVAQHKENISAVSEYAFDEDIEFEFVTTNKGEQWVSFWAVWKAKLAANGQEINTPVHVSMKIKDGKVVREYGYWDNAPMMMALMELEKEAAASSE